MFSSWVAGIPQQADQTHRVDLRSDTVTIPSMALRKLMVNTEVGDDVFYDDPTINTLQSEAAQMFGKEASLLVPSGTMGNLISIMLHCRHKGDAAIIGKLSHINNWERGNLAAAASIMPIVIANNADGTMDLDEVDFFCREQDPHIVTHGVIVLENSMSECGGVAIRSDHVKQVKKMAKKYKMKMHLDGARVLNAAGFLGISPAEIVKDFDTVSVCLSKGIGAPVGTLVIGSQKDIQQALIFRKMLGGNLRQAGIIARAAIENLKTWEETVQTDHRHAQILAETLRAIPGVQVLHTAVETNMVYFNFLPDYKKHTVDSLKAAMLDNHGIQVSDSIKGFSIRMVTHRDLSSKDIKAACVALQKELS